MHQPSQKFDFKIPKSPGYLLCFSKRARGSKNEQGPGLARSLPSSISCRRTETHPVAIGHKLDLVQLSPSKLKHLMSFFFFTSGIFLELNLIYLDRSPNFFELLAKSATNLHQASLLLPFPDRSIGWKRPSHCRATNKPQKFGSLEHIFLPEEARSRRWRKLGPFQAFKSDHRVEHGRGCPALPVNSSVYHNADRICRERLFPIRPRQISWAAPRSKITFRFLQRYLVSTFDSDHRVQVSTAFF